MERIPLEDLYSDTVDLKPRNFDFSVGFTDRWEIVYPEGWDFDEGELDYISPMMNYLYPLPDDFRKDAERRFGSIEAAAKVLSDATVNLTLIYLMPEEEYGLALTGGGMDFSWEICEGFMTLGYLPPFHFCHLPRMAGKRATEGNLWVLDACRRSANIISGWADTCREDLDRVQGALEIPIS
ncbi:MAG: hypothetical protein ABIH46_07395 [Chloroflexota bacterium]